MASNFVDGPGKSRVNPSHWVALLVLTLLLLLPAASTAAEPTASVPPALDKAPIHDEAVSTVLDMLDDGQVDERDVRLTFMAQMERQGYYPIGTVAAIQREYAQADAAYAIGGRAPGVVYRQTFPICDVNGDGVEEMLVNSYDYGTARPSLYLYDGETGSYLWYRYGSYFFYEFGPFARGGLPNPWVPWNAHPTSDANGDGVCDILTLGFTFTLNYAATSAAVVYGVHTYVSMVDATTGFNIWNKEYTGTYAQAGALVTAAYAILNLPTGFAHYHTPTGPKYVLKTTDYFQYIVQDPLSLCYFSTVWTSEHLYLANATTGAEYWTRDLTFNPDDRTTNLTWISGVANVAGDEEPDIVLDQFFFYNPRTCDLSDPTNGRPLFRYGRGMNMQAIDGALNNAGANHWSTRVRDEDQARTNTASEERFVMLVNVFGQVLPDMTGDGYAEPVALLLMREYNEAPNPDGVPTSGSFATILAPLDGASGAKLWPHEVRQQGWGFASDLSATAEPVPFIAFATIDVPTPTPPEGRFPPKDVRMAVLNITDGSHLWSYGEKFPQDSYLSYDLALNQYYRALAPYDWNGDGLRDLVTPSQYIKPLGTTQVLLSTATHKYTIMSGVDGVPLHEVSAWGSNGAVVPCGPNRDDLTVFGGHAKRIDVSRLAVRNETLLWRQPIWNDPTPTAATAGVDLIFIGAQCSDRPDGRIHLELNLGAFSFKRGYEIIPVYGFADGVGTAVWQHPKLQGFPPTYDFLAKIVADKQAAVPTPVERATVSLVPAVPGGIAGVALAFLRSRKGGGIA